MARPRQPGMTENELEIMKALWVDSPLTVGEILTRLVRRPRPAYTSLLTVVQAMEKKGYVRHFKDGKAFSYFPKVKERDFVFGEVARMAKRLFNGGPSSLVINLVEGEHLSPEEIAELRQMLVEK